MIVIGTSQGREAWATQALASLPTDLPRTLQTLTDLLPPPADALVLDTSTLSAEDAARRIMAFAGAGA